MYDDAKWEPMWERNDKANRDSKYRLMWSKDDLGEDETFDDLDVLRASFRENCKTRLKTYKNDPKGYANVPVIPESMYEKYVAGSWYYYDSCCWVNLEWAADYGGLRPGAYFGDLNGYAKLMGVKVDSAQVVFGSNFIPKLENEPGLIGRIAGSQKGKTVGPWKGENGVYVFMVYDVKTDGRKPSKEELDQRFKQQRGGGLYANPNAMAYVLSRATKVKRSLINFY